METKNSCCGIINNLVQKDLALDYFTSHLPKIDLLEFRTWEERRTVDTHIHEEVSQIDHFIEGVGTYTIDDKKFSITPEFFFVIPTQHKHAIVSSQKNPLRGFTAKFRLPDFYYPFLPLAFSLKDEVVREAENLLRLAVSECLLQQDKRKLVASLRLMEVIILLVRSYTSTDNKNTDNYLVEAGLQYMRRHYSESISLDDIGAEAGVSPAHLCRVFRKVTGNTPFDALRRIRCEYVKERLINSRKKVFEIAAYTGFGSAQHLNRVFRSVVGMSPGAYRKKPVQSSKQQL